MAADDAPLVTRARRGDAQAYAALFRGLPFKREVSLAKESSDAPTAPSEGIFSDEYGAQSLVHITRTYKRLGLLPESIDFAAALADYTRLERIFYYESRKDLIVISPVATQVLQVMREERGRNLEQLPVVLALILAPLQIDLEEIMFM